MIRERVGFVTVELIEHWSILKGEKLQVWDGPCEGQQEEMNVDWSRGFYVIEAKVHGPQKIDRCLYLPGLVKHWARVPTHGLPFEGNQPPEVKNGYYVLHRRVVLKWAPPPDFKMNMEWPPDHPNCRCIS
jgi:hypothetical protein